MNNKIDISHLTLDIEHDKKKILKCESCEFMMSTLLYVCLLYTSDAADEAYDV